MRPETQARGRRKGFTLIEMMVVIMIMAILGTIVFGITGFASRKAASSRAMAQIQDLKNALEQYRLKFNMYPLVTGPATTVLTNLVQFNKDLVFTDPWERPYQFESQGKYQFRLWSYGPDTNNTQTKVETL